MLVFLNCLSFDDIFGIAYVSWKIKIFVLKNWFEKPRDTRLNGSVHTHAVVGMAEPLTSGGTHHSALCHALQLFANRSCTASL